MNPNFIFVAYHYEFKHRFSNVSFMAEKSNTKLDNIINVNTKELDEIIKYLELTPELEDELLDKNYIRISEHNNETENIKKIKKIIRRLSTYSNDLAGTPMYMQQEKNKLLAMVTSQTILSNTVWRWFITHTPKDLYESKLFDIILKDELLNKPDIYKEFKDIEKYTDTLTLIERNKLLVSHPCLMIRLFKIKQNCIWKYILSGDSKPLGKINEFWIRSEVSIYYNYNIINNYYKLYYYFHYYLVSRSWNTT
jgi:hypothetical protein